MAPSSPAWASRECRRSWGPSAGGGGEVSGGGAIRHPAPPGFGVAIGVADGPITGCAVGQEHRPRGAGAEQLPEQPSGADVIHQLIGPSALASHPGAPVRAVQVADVQGEDFLAARGGAVQQGEQRPALQGPGFGGDEPIDLTAVSHPTSGLRLGLAPQSLQWLCVGGKPSLTLEVRQRRGNSRAFGVERRRRLVSPSDAHALARSRCPPASMASSSTVASPVNALGSADLEDRTVFDEVARLDRTPLGAQPSQERRDRLDDRNAREPPASTERRCRAIAMSRLLAICQITDTKGGQARGCFPRTYLPVCPVIRHYLTLD
ncbi:hypothetical protein FHX42_001266 [Saccharopolyspora lacisalsi]|uniref:Uncharacterized protein n=1 Tax=Halosaccharopolyspora lacisalsi TaxID=1000566 RepID=A0A839DWW5_9PSEU|nr:hypothetical protein [Halosaccharopolyspora lacisalsi]